MKKDVLRFVAWNEDNHNSDLLSENGMILINENKNEFGSLMVESKSPLLNTSGFTTKGKRVAFINGPLEDLEEIVRDYGIKDLSPVEPVYGPSRIVIVEKLRSQIKEGKDGFSIKVNPKTEEELTFEGEDIFRRTFIVPKDSSHADILIEHDRDEDADEDASVAKASEEIEEATVVETEAVAEEVAPKGKGK